MYLLCRFLLKERNSASKFGVCQCFLTIAADGLPPSLHVTTLPRKKIKINILKNVFNHHILALKMNNNVSSISRKITKILLRLEFTI